MSLTWKDVAVVSAVSGISTLNVFLNGALTVGLPSIGKALDFKQADLQWPVNVFSLSYGCLLILFGRLGDIFGNRFMILAGSSWFTVWSIASAFAPNAVAFIIFIALLGVGAAANTPSGIGLIVAYFPAGPRRNRAVGILGAGQPLGFIVGLVLGGLIIQSKATWRGIFYVQAGLSFLLFTLSWFVLPQDERARRPKVDLDWGGTVLSISGIGLLTFSLADSTSTSQGWASPRVIGTTVTATTLLILFWYYERFRELKGQSALVPPKMWKQPGAKMVPMISMIFFAWWSFNTLIYFAMLYYQQVIGLGPLETSIHVLPMVVAGLCANLIGSWLVNRIPGQPLMLLGFLGNVGAPILFALMNIHASYWTSSFWVMILIVGADIAYPVGAIHISSKFDQGSQSLAGALFNVATRLGTSIGVAITSSVANSVTQRYAKRHAISETSPEALMAGFRAAGWTLCGAAAVSVLIGLIGLRGIGIVGQKRTPDVVVQDMDGGLELQVVVQRTDSDAEITKV